MSEQIEHIYDRLIAEEKLKSGTKYERLAALVFQILERGLFIVHDVVLKGPGKEAEHQIDVSATDSSGRRRRIIVEARDRKERVGLGQVRDFFGVVHQLAPDYAWIVSVTGFTEDAVKYARDEGIRLAVLRPADADEDDRIKAIHIRMAMRALGTPTITTWIAKDDEERARLQSAIAGREGKVLLADAGAESFFDEAGNRVASMQEVLTPIFNGLQLDLGENEGTYEFEGTQYFDLLGVRAAIKGFTYRVELTEGIREFTVGNASSVAELIFRSVEGTVPEGIDRVIYDTDLTGLTFDTEGNVRRRPTGA